MELGGDTPSCHGKGVQILCLCVTSVVSHGIWIHWFQLPLRQIYSHPPSLPEFFSTSILHSSLPPFLSIFSPLGLLLWGNRAWLFFRTNGMNSITWNTCPVLSDNTPWGVFLFILCFENLKDVNPRWGLSRVLGFTKVLSFVALSKHRLPTVFLCTCLSFIPPGFPLLLVTFT